MIKVKTSKGITKFDIKGDVCELSADLVLIAQTVCREVAAKNPEHAALLVQFIADELKSPEFLKEAE